MHGHERAKAARDLKKQYKDVVFNRLGNWQTACKKLDIRFEDLAVYPYATKDHVVEGLRRWSDIGGENFKRLYAEDRALVEACFRFYGTMKKAFEGAGEGDSSFKSLGVD